jgi:crossover junction endodeoxyribonuclease RuvC
MWRYNLSKKQIILGVDPGTRITGYGVIQLDARGEHPLDFGCVRPPPSHPLAERYLAIFQGIAQLIQQHQPHALAVETQFVYKNAQSAIKLGMARCAVILAAAQAKVPIFEYTPRKAKLAVVGNGGSSKEQVQKMIQLLLRLKELPEPEDAADALALALCHAHTCKGSYV